MTTIERVQATVGNDLGVQVWEGIKLPGVELFYAANTVEYRGIAVIDGGAPMSGAEAFKAVRARGVSDPTQLAALSLLFFRKGGNPIVDATEAGSQPPAVRAAIKPPAIHGNVLEFWGWDEQHEQVMRHQLDLTTLQLQSQNGQLVTNQSANPIDQALARLAGPSATMYQGAIDDIVAACSDPRAAAALSQIITTHQHADARSWAAFQSPNCHDAKTVPALVSALERDKDARVRKQAADALGKLKATAARDALTKAQSDPDADVSGAAGRALKKL
jgi:hypothetical protein